MRKRSGYIFKHMTRFILILPYIFWLSPAMAQLYNYFEGFSNLPVVPDTSTGAFNPWQVGTPQKDLFAPAFSEPNAIVTNTAENYQPGTNGTFAFTIKYTEDYWQYPYILLLFRHKMQVDSLHAGGWIEVSYNGGNSWNNIYQDPQYPVAVIDFSPRDTLFNGELGFATDFTDSWRLTTVCWGVLADRPQVPPEPDSIIVRFHFAADSMANPGSGWIIDNLEVYPEIIHTVEDLRSMSENEALVVYPNPATDYLNLFYRVEQTSPMNLNIFDLQGRLLYREDRGLTHKGIYSEQIDLKGLPVFPSGPIVLTISLEGRQLTRLVLRNQ